MENDLIEYVKFKISMSKIKEETKVKEKHKITKPNIKIGIAACAFFCLITGCVFAEDIGNFIKDKFGIGSRIQTAVENDYLENVSMDYIYSNSILEFCSELDNNIETLNTGIKVNDFLIDDTSLSMEVSFKFDKKIKEYISLENLYKVTLSNVDITDNEGNIIYSTNKENLDNENYINCGVNINSLSYSEDENIVTINYNFYVEDKELPNSKKINISIKELSLDFSDENKIFLNGDWQINLDVPEKMYLREEQEYEVVSCDNSDFTVYASKVTDTGFEVGIKVSNITEPEFPEELKENEEKIYETKGNINIPENSTDSNIITIATAQITSQDIIEFYENSEYKELYENYYTNKYPIGNTRENYIYWFPKTEGNYIENSNGEKFYPSNYIGSTGKQEFTSENSYDYYETFDMTRFDATDEIKLVIELYGESVVIILNKLT